MLKVGLVDANERANPAYAGITASVISGWLVWEMGQAGVPVSDVKDADIVFLVYAGSINWVSNCRSYLRRAGIIADAEKRDCRPYIIAGGPVDATPFTALKIADALAVGEAYTFVRELLRLIADGADLAYLSGFIVDYPHAIERGQLLGLEVDPDAPWLLKGPAPKLARPDNYVDWSVPPIRSDDKVVRIIAEKGCHGKCVYCATTYRQEHVQNPNGYRVITLLEGLKAKGERVQLLSNDPMNLPYFRDIRTRLDSQSFTILEVSDPENRAAIIRSGVGIARFGVEGLSERIRRAFGKPIASERLLEVLADLGAHKMDTHMFFITGAPGETHEDWLEFRAFYEQVTRTVKWGICRVKFTTFIPSPPAPLGRFVPDMAHEQETEDFRNWMFNNSVSRHLVNIFGRKSKTHYADVAEQLGITPELAAGLLQSPGTFDLAPTLEEARRMKHEVIEWPLSLEVRHKIGDVYKKRMLG